MGAGLLMGIAIAVAPAATDCATRGAETPPGHKSNVKRVALVPLVARGSVGMAYVAEFTREVTLAAQDSQVLSLVAQKEFREGGIRVPQMGGQPQQDSAVVTALERADKQVERADGMLRAGTSAKRALAVLMSAIDIYTAGGNFVELSDYGKLFRAYELAIIASHRSRLPSTKKLIVRALTLQETFVVDRRRAGERLHGLVERRRALMEPRRSCRISVTTSLPGGTVYVNGVKIGTPTHAGLRVDGLAPGVHYVRVRRKGHRLAGATVTARKGRLVKVKLTLKPTVDPQAKAREPVKPKRIVALSQSGDFHSPAALEDMRRFCDQLQAQGLLFGVVAGRDGTLAVEQFLFDRARDQVMAVSALPLSKESREIPLGARKAVASVEATWLASGRLAINRDRVVRSRPPVDELTRVSHVTGPTATSAPAQVPTPIMAPRRPAESKSIWSSWWFWTAVATVAATAGIVAATQAGGDEPAPASSYVVATTLPARPDPSATGRVP